MNQDKITRVHTDEEMKKYKLAGWVAFAFLAASYVANAVFMIIDYVASGRPAANDSIIILLVMLAVLPGTLVGGSVISSVIVTMYLFVVFYLAADCLDRKNAIAPIMRFFMIFLLTPFWLIAMLAAVHIFDTSRGLSVSIIGAKIVSALMLAGVMTMVVALFRRFSDDKKLKEQ